MGKRFTEGKYILEGKTIVKCYDLIEWATWMETADRRVALDTIHQYEISTVFLGLDHGFGMSEDPVLFETMVFKILPEPEVIEIEMPNGTARVFEFRKVSMEDIDGLMRRYCTWEEAEEGHKEIVKLVKKFYMKLVVNGGTEWH